MSSVSNFIERLAHNIIAEYGLPKEKEDELYNFIEAQVLQWVEDNEE